MKPNRPAKSGAEMPPAKSYGRQKPDQTIKSVSIQKDLADFAVRSAKAEGVSLSKWLNDLLEKHLSEEAKSKKKR